MASNFWMKFLIFMIRWIQKHVERFSRLSWTASLIKGNFTCSSRRPKRIQIFSTLSFTYCTLFPQSFLISLTYHIWMLIQTLQILWLQVIPEFTDRFHGNNLSSSWHSFCVNISLGLWNIAWFINIFSNLSNILHNCLVVLVIYLGTFKLLQLFFELFDFFIIIPIVD